MRSEEQRMKADGEGVGLRFHIYFSKHVTEDTGNRSRRPVLPKQSAGLPRSDKIRTL